MGDIKLYAIAGKKVHELAGQSLAVEKSLQTMIERNLLAVLGVHFLASEYSTGRKHGGRIDTLGLDENSSPVIIEYKRSIAENIINQGLYYLDWLLDHKAEFALLVRDQLDKQTADSVEWPEARLICIAGEFSKYDQHAVEQINRNVSLIRYRKYEDGLLLLELVNAVEGPQHEKEAAGAKKHKKRRSDSTIEERLAKANSDLHDVWDALRSTLLELGDDVQLKTLKNYFGFQRLRNFACVEIHPQANKIAATLNVDPAKLSLEDGFSRDVTDVGHWGTGDLELTLRTMEDLQRAMPLFLKAYERS